jgi:isocitrate dehydrogenase
VNQLDNRGSTFYVALFWAEELAKQTEDADLAAKFKALASNLREDEPKIAEELLSVQGNPADLGGYYRPDPVKTTEIMRPSKTLNDDLAALSR